MNSLYSKYILIIFCILFLQITIKAPGKNSPALKEPRASSNPRQQAEKLTKEGFELMVKGFGGDARKLFLKAIESDESYYKPYLELGLLYRWEDIDNLSIPYLEKAKTLSNLELKTQKPNLPAEAVVDKKRILRLLSGAYLNENRTDESKRIAKKLLQQSKNASDYGQLAWILFKENNLDEAEKIALEGIAKNKTDLASRNTLAIVYSHKRKFNDALFQYNSLSARDKNSPVILNNSGETLMALFRYNQAASKYILALAFMRRHNTALTHINLASLYLDTLQIEKARRVLQGYTGHKDWGFYILSLVRVNYMKGNIKEAKKLLDEAGRLRQTYGHIGWGKDNFDYLYAYWASSIYKALALAIRSSDSFSFLDDLRIMWNSAKYQLLAWWYRGKASRIIAGNSKMQSDFFVHSSDNSYNYPELENMISLFPYQAMKQKLLALLDSDTRKEAGAFYLSWLARLEWENNNGIYGNIYMYRALAMISKDKFPLLYLSLLRQKRVFGRERIAGLMLYSFLPSYAFYSEIKLPIRIYLDRELAEDFDIKTGDNNEKKSKLPISKNYNLSSSFFQHANNDEAALIFDIKKNKDIYRVKVVDEIFAKETNYSFTIPPAKGKRVLNAILYKLGLEIYNLKFPFF